MVWMQHGESPVSISKEWPANVSVSSKKSFFSESKSNTDWSMNLGWRPYENHTKKHKYLYWAILTPGKNESEISKDVKSLVLKKNDR